MAKLYLSNRDSLLCIDLESIALLKAEGNYTRLYYINQHDTLLAYGIGYLFEVLSKMSPGNYHFVRLGRSIIINHTYLQKIDLQKQILELANQGKDKVRISIPKNVLRSYKTTVEKSVVIKKNGHN
ncbi:MAG: LytTR family transcriptional regulator DNA-binding domain-containing protein [Prevotella sp.]|nr:LytTR family transcriptional regulator DNA-binding domain-containing protein [Prevotella sp.]